MIWKKLKIKKRLVAYASLLALTASLGTGVSEAGKYDSVNLPSVIPTAYQDAQRAFNEKQKQADTAKTEAKESTEKTEENKDGNNPQPKADGDNKEEEKKKEEAAKNASESAKKTMEHLNKNIKQIMDTGNFGSVGVLFGPTSGSSGGIDAYGQLTSSGGMDDARMASFGNDTGQADKVAQYHAFGLAMTKLKDRAHKTDPTAMSFPKTVDAFEQIAIGFASFGINFVKAYNPLPVIASFYDSSFLYDAAYNGGSQDNELIKIINGSEYLRGMVKLFGDPVAVGSVHTSMAYMITGTLVFISIGYAAFQKLWNGDKAMITFRKSLLRIVVAAVAVPLIANGGSHAIKWVGDIVGEKDTSIENHIVSNNLHIHNWYKNAAFGLPQGVVLQVVNGEFIFTPDIVKAINDHSSTNTTSAASVTVTTTTKPQFEFGIFKWGEKKEHKQTVQKSEKLSMDDLSKQILASATTNNNLTKVVFSPSYGNDKENPSNPATVPWSESAIRSFAEDLGSGKEYKPGEGDDNITASEYINVSGLVGNGSKGSNNFTFSGNGSNYGISPLAAYNLMATDFNESGFVVSTNTDEIITPTVAVSITNASSGSENNAPAIVKLIVLFTMIGVSIKAFMSIITAGFGGLFRGSAGSVLGSTAGFGTAVGGIAALTIGLFGLSLIIMLAIELIDIMWIFIFDLIGGSGIDNLIDQVGDELLGKIKEIPVIGWMLDGILESIAKLAIGISMIMLLPQIVKTPIVAYGEWVAGVPGAISERFANWERKFTGDYHSGGGSMFGGGRGGGGRGGGGGGSAMDKMKADEAKKREGRMGAVKTGGAMIAGASLSYLGATLENAANQDVNAEAGKDESVKTGDENQNVENATELENTQDVQEQEFNNDEEQETELENSEFREMSDVDSVVEDNDLSQQSDEDITPPGPEDSVAGEDGGADENDSLSPEQGASQETPVPDEKPSPEALAGAAAAGAVVNGDNVNGDNINESKSLNEANEGDSSSSNEEKKTEQTTNADKFNEDAKTVDNDTSLSQNNTEAKVKSDTSIDGSSKEASQSLSTENTSNQSNSDAKSVANMSMADKARSGLGRVADKVKGAGQKTSSAINKGTQKALGANDSKRRSIARVTGKTLQALGGKMVGVDSNAKGKDAVKAASAGLLHVAGGLTGMQKMTGGVAQRQIDKRNERLRRAGHDIPDNLSTAQGRKPTRDMITRDVDAKIARTDAALNRQLERVAPVSDAKVEQTKVSSVKESSDSSEK